MTTKFIFLGILPVLFPSISHGALQRGLGGGDNGGGGGGNGGGSMNSNSGDGTWMMPCGGNRRRRTKASTTTNPFQSSQSNRRIKDIGRTTTSDSQNQNQNDVIDPVDQINYEDDGIIFEWTDDANGTFWWEDNDYNYTDTNNTDANFTGFNGDREKPEGDDPFAVNWQDECDEEQEESSTDDNINNATDFDDDFIRDNHTTPAPIIPTGVTNTQPVNITMAPSIAPSKPPSARIDAMFLDPNLRSTIYCRVSTAMPVYPNSEISLERQQAERLLMKVAIVIGEIMLLESDGEIETTVDLAAPILDATQDNGNYRALTTIRQLRWNYVLSNVTAIPMNNNTPPHESWWLHSVAFDTVDSNASAIQEFMEIAVSESLKSRGFESKLRRYFKRLVAARRVGFEQPTLVPEDDDDVLETLQPSPSPTLGKLSVVGWDIRSWVGLGMFSFTLILLITLTHTAQHRRKKLKEEEEWGAKLGSDQAVEQLLTYGWKRDGSKVRFFDKHDLGYTDDDSVLLGGVQPEMTLPSSGLPSEKELTFKQIPTTATSSTGGQSNNLSGFKVKPGTSQSGLSNFTAPENVSAISATSSQEEHPHTQDNPQDDS